MDASRNQKWGTNTLLVTESESWGSNGACAYGLQESETAYNVWEKNAPEVITKKQT